MTEDAKAPFFEPLVREGGYFTELTPDAYRAAMEPFPVSAIEWRVIAGGEKSENGIVAPFADLRHYQNRLRQLFGSHASLTIRPWQPNSTLLVARLELFGTIYEDVGEKEGGKNDLTSSYAQAVKRVMVAMLGMGAYLYLAFPQVWVKIKKTDRGSKFPHPDEFGKLRQQTEEASENWRLYLDGDLSVTGRDYYDLLDIELRVAEAEDAAQAAIREAQAAEQARRRLQAQGKSKEEAKAGPVVAAGRQIAPTTMPMGEPTDALNFSVKNTATVSKHTGKSQAEFPKVTLRDLVTTEDGRGYLEYVKNRFSQAGAKEAATAVLEWWDAVGIDGLDVPGVVVSGGTKDDTPTPTDTQIAPVVDDGAKFDPKMTNLKALVLGLGLKQSDLSWAWDTLKDPVDGIWKDGKPRSPDDTDAWKAAFEWLKLKAAGGKATSTVPFDQSPQ